MIKFNYRKTKNKHMSNRLDVSYIDNFKEVYKHFYKDKIKNAWILWCENELKMN